MNIFVIRQITVKTLPDVMVVYKCNEIIMSQTLLLNFKAAICHITFIIFIV